MSSTSSDFFPTLFQAAFCFHTCPFTATIRKHTLEISFCAVNHAREGEVCFSVMCVKFHMSITDWKTMAVNGIPNGIPADV